MRSARTRAMSALAATVLGACGPITEPLDGNLDTAVEFTPPREWRSLWAEVEACSGMEGDFDAVRWFTVEGLVVAYGKSYHAAWLPEGPPVPNAIVYDRRKLEVERVVKHEMLHAIARYPAGQHGPAFLSCMV
jgi:hypothetical protein